MKPVDDFDLPRLKDLDDPVLTSVIGELRANKPDATELASLASRLALQGLAVTTPPPAPANPSSALWKKWAIGGGAAVSGAALWLSLGSTQVAAPAAPAAPATSTAVVSIASVVDSPSAPAQPAGRGNAALPTSTARPGPSQPEVVEPTSRPAPETPQSDAPVASSPSVAAAKAPPVVGRAPRDDSARSSLESSGPGTRSAATPAAIASSTSSEAPSNTALPTEIELLRDARLALKQSPAQALELADSHARTYPGGKLSQERELIAISALVALGRRTAALSRANRFAQAFPESPYRKQIGELLQ